MGVSLMASSSSLQELGTTAKFAESSFVPVHGLISAAIPLETYIYREGIEHCVQVFFTDSTGHRPVIPYLISIELERYHHGSVNF